MGRLHVGLNIQLYVIRVWPYGTRFVYTNKQLVAERENSRSEAVSLDPHDTPGPGPYYTHGVTLARADTRMYLWYKAVLDYLIPETT